MDIGSSFSRVKWLGREAYHSPLSSTEVKYPWSYTSTPTCTFMTGHLFMRRSYYFHLCIPVALFPRVKRPERKAYHSPSPGADIMCAWNYTSTPQYVFMAWRLIKHEANFSGLFPRGKTAGRMNLTTHLYLVPWLCMPESAPPLPLLRLRGVMLN
jgi:hypothetical protein